MVERLSTSQLINILTGQISDSQQRLFDISKKMSLGTKYTEPHEAPVAMVNSLRLKGDIKGNDTDVRERNIAEMELRSAETAITSVIDMLQRNRELTIQGASDAMGPDEREMIAEEIRTGTEAIMSMANTKANGKYIFSGDQTDVQTFRLDPGADFSSTVYKQNEDNQKQRYINGIQVSMDVGDAFTRTAEDATVVSKRINPTVSADADLELEVSDGAGTTTTFTASLSAGDDLSTVITKINTAFTTAGGAGSIVQESPAGYLSFDTGLVTGSSSGQDAHVKILKTSDLDLVNELGFRKGTFKGKDAGVFQAMSQLENALNTDDGATVRGLLSVIDYNLRELSDLRSEIGSLTNRVGVENDYSVDLDIKLRQDLSVNDDLDILEASLELSNAEAAVNSAVQVSSNYFSRAIAGLGRFLGVA